MYGVEKGEKHGKYDGSNHWYLVIDGDQSTRQLGYGL